MINVANAPVSYGVFEMDAEEGVQLPGADDLLEQVAGAGYVGIDSGPIGLFGRGQQLRERLVFHNLALAGGFVSMPFSDDAAFAALAGDYRAALEVFAAAAQVHPQTPPRPTLADSGSRHRRAHPGGGPGLSLDGHGWDTLARNVTAAVDMAADYALVPTFHHHACTFVETPQEIDEFLTRTTVGLTFDTGHLMVGGGDPVEGLRRWCDRIDHLHLKDVRTEVVRDVIDQRAGMRKIWTDRAFVPLGDGDLDLTGVMEQILGSGYDGWLVVEQDVIVQVGDDPRRAQGDQIRNRAALERWLPGGAR